MSRILFTIAVSMLAIISYGQSGADLVKKGLLLSDQGLYSEAIEQFTIAIQQDPSFQDAYAKRAFTYGISGNYEKAIEDYSALIAMNPSLVSAYLSRGSAYNKIKQWQLAITDFDVVLSLDPSNSEAYNNRGWSKKGMGDKEGACEDWKASKKLGNQEAKIILKNNQC